MNRNKTQIVAAVALVMVAVVGILMARHSVVYRTEISEFSLKASVSDAAGISPKSHFILKTTKPLTAQVLEKYVKVVPETDIDIEAVPSEANTFEIIPAADLQPDRIYTLSVDKGPLADRAFSWAYQVKAPFQITSSLPADKSNEVPSNTGIELYFNRDTIINPEKFISISPSVAGVFQSEGNKVRFIPSLPLADRTIYTITISAGLQAQGTLDTFAADQTIQFQTGQTYSENRPASAYFSRSFAEFKPGADILFGVTANNTTSIDTTVYRLDSAQDFMDSVKKVQGDTPWAHYSSNIESGFSVTNKVFSGSLPIETANYSSTIRMPQTLPVGYYALIISSGSNRDISWFQVNPAASFSAFAGSKSLVWLKNISTEQNISGATVLLDGMQLAQSGTDGVAMFATPAVLMSTTSSAYPASNARRFLVAKIPTGDLVIPIENEYGSPVQLNQNDTWWDYISLNKNVYLPTDTLHFWAIQKPRAGSAADGTGDGQIDVKLTNPYWSGSQAGIVTYAETKVTLSDYDAITGEMSFADLKPGIYDLTFTKGTDVIAKQTVTVSAYIKPAYKITVVPDKNAVFAGEAVNFKVKAEFFDGTPVSKSALSFEAYGLVNGNSTGRITLDSNGEGSFSITPSYSDKDYYWPSYMSVTVKPAQAEEGRIQTNTSVFVFGPHINDAITQTQSDAAITFAVKTRGIVINEAAIGKSYWNADTYLGAPVAGALTTTEVSQVIYLRTQTGTSYDPINKLTYPVYDYSTRYDPLASQIITSDQNGSAQFSYKIESKKTYRFVFTTTDSTGRSVTETRFAYGSGGDDSAFADASADGSAETEYYLSNPDEVSSYKIGDPISLRLQTSQGGVAPTKPGDYIFLTVNNGSIEYRVQDTPKYEAAFRAQDIPNIGVWSAWFGNDRFHNSYSQNLSFNADERRLNVAVALDKQSYAPGGSVALDIKVTDKDAHPVKAEVNVSALDEAVFAVQPDEKDIVNDLYKDIYSQVVLRTSNLPAYGGGGAEKGGGDGDAPRSDIQEMALFKSLTTDSSGHASVQFKLPDNITSWRLTSQAVTKDLFAGKSINFIPVTLPFFVDTTLNATYLAGDQLTLRARTFGVAGDQGTVSYSAESPTLPFKTASVSTGNTSNGNSVDIPLGKLTAGTHQLTIRAKSGNLSDAITRPLTVLDSYFSKDVSDFYEGTDGLKISNDATGYTTLSFSPLGRGRLYGQLKSLTYQYGLRLDQKGAQLVATNLLNSYFGEKNDLPDIDASKYRSYNGGMQLLPYSSDDIELSAIAAHLFDSSLIDKPSLKTYFLQSLSDTKSDSSRISRALYGLSALDEPVLTKIESIKDDASLKLTDKVFIALALDSIGAKEEARDYYASEIKPSLVVKSSYAYVGSLTGDETITTTALVAVLTANLEEPESSQLAAYADQNFPRETLSNFERLLYIQSALPKLDAETVSFSYTAGSKSETATLKNDETFSVTLSPAELASFKLSDVKGSLGVTASYEQPSSPDSISKDKDLSIKRAYEVDSLPTTEFSEGDLVLVRLTPNFSANALGGAYQIVDYLPSGLRAADQETSDRSYADSARLYPTEIDGQKVTFVLDKSNTIPIYYYARVVSKGTYKAEPALLQSLKSLDSATISHADSITVK
jgi:alpha-2-macroglobulin